MSTFEKLVRPFETGTPFTSRRLPPVPPAPAELGLEPEPNPSLTWGKGHPGNFDMGINDGPTGWETKFSETARETETVRVFQNNDETSSNYVDIERINRLKLESNKGDVIEIDNNWENSGGTVV
jgi:hypothetical protein